MIIYSLCLILSLCSESPGGVRGVRRATAATSGPAGVSRDRPGTC